MGQGCSDERMVEIMQQFDVDKSGTIDFTEFLTLIATFYKNHTPKPSPTPAPTPSKPAQTATKTTPSVTVTPTPSQPPKTAPTTTTTPANRSPSPNKGRAPSPTPTPSQPPKTTPTTTTPSSSTGSGSKIGAGSQKCPGCGKSVFAAEKMTGINNEWWHKLCFKCGKCSALLTAGNYQDHDGKMFCKKCHQLHFANSGYGPGRVGSFQN